MVASVGSPVPVEDPCQPLLKGSVSKVNTAHPLHQNPRCKLPAAVRSGACWPICLLPLAIWAGYRQWSPVLVFVYNLFAIIALSACIFDSSLQLATRASEPWGALINIGAGNAVGLSLGAWAVASREISVAQSLAMGAILADILLVLGSCLLAASHRADILFFDQPVTRALSSLMLVTAMVLVLPSVLSLSVPYELGDQTVAVSRGTSAVLLFVYAGYLYFQLGTHRHLFHHDGENMGNDADADTEAAHPSRSAPQTRTQAFLTLTLALLATLLCTKYLTETLVRTAVQTHFSETLLATVLVPVASTVAPAMAMIQTSATSQDVGAAISAGVQTVVHVALFRMPVLVLLGWALGSPMSLVVDPFQTVVLLFSVVLVHGLLHGGKYSVMHGLALIAMYAILGLAFCVR
ncbi:uncharacterized protein BP01DRAFT_359511 [Aspergillus saccharolyticus JOP 1030-1]|uniref:Sodium/calcium exchanger membrane region domain-containing protein n=1 Tax=Aspergillus saccharolyticus JOP 1030-1 TaxID=1450539 RepID=A0A318Z5N3_9EURO|nr:hypothetical protein BP01DRAFT_359511 [Aspergillus saccharolyticus JOP 1030-1]PYH42426.1 hypothetical protein BP01DRAFT_359511 [Aspergillus saccharolyticus JOP 1030-1]